MNLDSFSKKNAQLRHLLTQSAHWQRLNTYLRQELPANMHKHFTVACVRAGDLVVIAHNSMIATRLRMVLPTLLPALQLIDENSSGDNDFYTSLMVGMAISFQHIINFFYL